MAIPVFVTNVLYRVKTLSDGAQRFKVRKNADWFNLTGLVICHPQFCMVYVEGAVSLMKKYKRLMLERVKWTVAAQARDGGDEDAEEGDEGDEGQAYLAGSSTSKVDEGQDGEYGSASLEGNRCDLIWEGQIRERVFKGLRWRHCPTDGTAKEALGEKMAGFWDQTKNWKADEVELF